MNKSSSGEELEQFLTKLSEPFWDSLEKESDRAIAVTVGCLLDNILERLLRTFYVKDTQVKHLFTNDHILQTFSAKINIAYFSGLIPQVVYRDLKLIGGIRNIFAHEITSGFSFSNEKIVQKINSCELRPKTLEQHSVPRFKFIIIVQQIIALLGVCEQLLVRTKPIHLVDMFNLNKRSYNDIALTKSEILDVIRGESRFLNSEEKQPHTK